MRIIVFGTTGMLGKYVSEYYKTFNYNVIEVNRKDVDVTDHNELYAMLNYLDLKMNDVVINCIGLVKQRININDLDFILTNAVFPHILANYCEARGAKMIHPSTDCVYSGLKGWYSEEDLHDAIDVYGKSKSLGEPKNCTVIRTSIIGEELRNKSSFIEWVKANKKNIPKTIRY